MKGQLTFDNFMNITEEKTQAQAQIRVPMVDCCYYCLCNSCVNNAESITITPEELPHDWKPCFFCDSCRKFDGESSQNMEREECTKYAIDNYHAAQNGKKIKIAR